MLQIIFNKHLEKERGANKSNIKRSNQALLKRIAICLDTLIKYNVGVDYYTPIYGNNFTINNKQRAKTLDILKQEKIIEVKTNEDGKESYQCSFTKKTKRNDVNNPYPKSYRFTTHGWTLIQNIKLVEQIKSYNIEQTTKYQTTDELIDDLLKKAAEDNLSLTFKLNKALPVVVEEYLQKVKREWKVTDKNYKYKYKEAERVVLNTIKNFNNKLLKFKERMYTALSLCPKELRQYILTPNGNYIDDGFDINSSIYTLLGATLLHYMKTNNITPPAKFYQQKERLQELCFNEEHIYSFIGRWNNGHWTKEQIKPHNMEVIFSNNEDIVKMDSKKTARNQIKQFLQTEFPVIWSILIHFKEEINEDYERELEQYNKYIQAMQFYKIKKQDWITAGKIDELKPFKPKHVNKPKQIKSTIWRYFEQVETNIMLKLKQQIEAKFNTTAYWIHDCLCFEQSLLTTEFQTQIKTEFKSLIESINSFQQLSNSFRMLPLLFGDSVEVELVDDDEVTKIVENERVTEEEDNEEKSEFEVLVDEINNLIEINIKRV